MKKIFSYRITSVASSVLVSVMAVALVGYAATTINTNVNTGGTLTVSGLSTLSGNVAADGTSATTTISGGLRADTSDNTLVVDFSSSQVGIGTTSPSALFSVHGNTILGSADASSVVFRAGTIGFASGASTTITSSNGFTWNTSDLVYDRGGLKFGIGTTSPSSRFAVQGGDAQITGTTTTSGLIATSTLFVGNIGQNFKVNSAGLVGVGTTTPGSLFSVQGGNAQITGTTTVSALHATSTLYVGNTGDKFLVNNAFGVGVGTTSPGSPFSVATSTLFGAADADTVSFRAGDIELNSNATTTIATKNKMGINFSTTTSTSGIVFDTLNSRLYVGSTTPSGGATLGLYSSGTTTLSIGNTVPQATNSEGGCIEMKAIGGSTVHLAATTTPVNGSVAVWMLGGCVVGNGS